MTKKRMFITSNEAIKMAWTKERKDNPFAEMSDFVDFLEDQAYERKMTILEYLKSEEFYKDLYMDYIVFIRPAKEGEVLKHKPQ